MRKGIILLLCVLLAVSCTGCGKELILKEDPDDAVLTELDGLELSVKYANRDAVTYTARNTSGTSFYYEGHIPGRLEKKVDGAWYPLAYRDDLTMTANFICAELTDTEETLTITVASWYTAPLSAGHYRVIMSGCPTEEALVNGDCDNVMYLAAEFDIE